MVCSHYPTLRPIKVGCIESSRGVHTAQRPTQTQIPIGFNFCANLSVSVSVSASVSGSANTQLTSQVFKLFELGKLQPNEGHQPLG